MRLFPLFPSFFSHMSATHPSQEPVDPSHDDGMSKLTGTLPAKLLLPGRSTHGDDYEFAKCFHHALCSSPHGLLESEASALFFSSSSDSRCSSVQLPVRPLWQRGVQRGKTSGAQISCYQPQQIFLINRTEYLPCRHEFPKRPSLATTQRPAIWSKQEILFKGGNGRANVGETCRLNQASLLKQKVTQTPLGRWNRNSDVVQCLSLWKYYDGAVKGAHLRYVSTSFFTF